MALGVDSAPSENEHQEHFLGVKAAGAWGWRHHHLHVPNVIKTWEPIPPGTLWTTPGLLRDCFTFNKTDNLLLSYYKLIFIQCTERKMYNFHFTPYSFPHSGFPDFLSITPPQDP